MRVEDYEVGALPILGEEPIDEGERLVAGYIEPVFVVAAVDVIEVGSAVVLIIVGC